MGRSALVDAQMVFGAADAIAAAGGVPTAPRIRELLGCGSQATIQTHLRNWRAQRGVSVVVVPDPEVPADLLACIKRSLKNAGEDARAKTQKALDDRNREFEIMRNEAQVIEAQLREMDQELIEEKAAKAFQATLVERVENELSEEKRVSTELRNKLHEADRKLDQIMAELIEEKMKQEALRKVVDAAQSELASERNRSGQLEVEVTQLKAMVESTLE
jgi:gamma-glutamylcysteine synthetase